MALGQFPGDGQAEAGGIRTAGAGEGLEQALADARRHARAVVGDADQAGPAHRLQRHFDAADVIAPFLMFDGLAGVAQQVDQHPVQLVRVGDHLIGGSHLGRQFHPRIGQPRLGGSLRQGLGQPHSLRLGRGFLGLAVGQHVRRQLDRPVQSAFETRQGLADLGVLQRRQPLRGQLRAGEHVLQVVVDLRHRLAQRRQPGAGVEGDPQIGLHPVQFRLGPADLVAAARELDPGLRIVRIGAEPLHGEGDPLHGPHQEQVQRQKDDQPGQGRHPGHDRHQAPQIAGQRLLELGVGGDELDEVGLAETRLGHHPHAVARAEQRLERREQAEAGGAVTEIHEIGRARRPRIGEHQAANALTGNRHDLHPGAFEELDLELFGHHPVGGDLGGQRGQFGGAHPVQQPLLLVGRHGRQDRQGAAQGRDHHGQHQQARGQAAGPEEAAAPVPYWRFGRRGDVRHRPSELLQPTALGNVRPLSGRSHSAPTASATDRKPSARRRTARSRLIRTTSPGPSNASAE